MSLVPAQWAGVVYPRATETKRRAVHVEGYLTKRVGGVLKKNPRRWYVYDGDDPEV